MIALVPPFLFGPSPSMWSAPGAIIYPHVVTVLTHAWYGVKEASLTSSANTGEDSQRSTPPAPDELARWLLVYEAGVKKSPEELAAAGERAYLQLRKRLVVLLGATGFDALWARGMHLAKPKFHSGDDPAANESFPIQAAHADGLHAAVSGHDSVVIEHNLVIVFASFITLLFRFIGEELGLRFIRQIWPELRLDAAASREEEATQ